MSCTLNLALTLGMVETVRRAIERQRTDFPALTMRSFTSLGVTSLLPDRIKAR